MKNLHFATSIMSGISLYGRVWVLLSIVQQQIRLNNKYLKGPISSINNRTWVTRMAGSISSIWDCRQVMMNDDTNRTCRYMWYQIQFTWYMINLIIFKYFLKNCLVFMQRIDEIMIFQGHIKTWLSNLLSVVINSWSYKYLRFSSLPEISKSK